VEISINAILSIYSVGAVYFQTYCMKKILEAIAEGGREKRAAAYIYALLAFFVALTKVSKLDTYAALEPTLIMITSPNQT